MGCAADDRAAGVTACLRGRYRGEKILASMGSLAHYMQELSREGFRIADFIHEGNGAIWELALTTGPAAHAAGCSSKSNRKGATSSRVECARTSRSPAGWIGVCAGGGVALYRRRADSNLQIASTARTAPPA